MLVFVNLSKPHAKKIITFHPVVFVSTLFKTMRSSFCCTDQVLVDIFSTVAVIISYVARQVDMLLMTSSTAHIYSP